MYDFNAVQEVRLGAGAHFSPEQGLCFMEMVAWFAGEAHSDKPDCACPVLGAYGIALNDNMPAGLRDGLLKPIVPLIAGTRGTLDDQRRRDEFLAMWAVNKVAPVALRAAGLNQEAERCEQAKTLDEAKASAATAGETAWAAAVHWAAATAWAAEKATAATAWAADWAAVAAAAAARPTAVAAEEVWQIAAEGLRQAILIGPHEGFDAAIDLAVRHDDLRRLVAA